MSEMVEPFAAYAAGAIEGVGIALIVTLALYALLRGAVQLTRGEASTRVYHQLRRSLGAGILIGLEFLVAADIIHTVAVELTFATVGVLAIIVIIRTFLSFTLDLELNGRWPWQAPHRSDAAFDDRKSR